MSEQIYQVGIVGAGPAGCSTALHLASKGIKVVIIDKEKFPRIKVCGGGISEQAADALKRLPGNVFTKFEPILKTNTIDGVRFVSPKNIEIVFPQSNQQNKSHQSGFVCSRDQFDQILLDSVKETGKVDVFEGITVKEVIREKQYFSIITDDKIFKCRLIVGADGVHSIVRNCLSPGKKIRQLQGIGIAATFRKEFSEPDKPKYLEFFFFRKYLPGYFWLFPVGDDLVSAGLYLPEKRVRKTNINLKYEFDFIIKSYSQISTRLAKAVMVEPPRAAALPWGRVLKPVSGNAFVLTGDAAGLTEPFTGEGIGPALLSGEIAAANIIRCFEQDAFGKMAMKRYDNQLYHILGSSLLSGSQLSMVFKYPAMVNYIFKMAQKSEKLRNFDINTIRKKGYPQKLSNPLMMFQVFFKMMR